MAKRTKLSQVSIKPVPVKIVDSSPKPSYDSEANERKWRAEDALRTCKEYAKIKGDKSLMADVKKLAKEEVKKLEAVAKKY